VSIGSRHFIFEDDGTLKRLSQRVHDGVHFRNDRLPQYAGAKVRMVSVYMPLDDGKPMFIQHIDAEIWHFDETGARLDAYGPGYPHPLDWLSEQDRKDAADKPAVVDVTDQIARRRWEEKYRWTPTAADITRVVNVIWPKQAGRPVPTPPQVTGTEKRRIPMTNAARRVLSGLWQPVGEITERVGDLNDKDLKAFIAGAREKADPIEPMANAVWLGIVAAAEKQLEIEKARMSSKGIWVASIEAERPSPDYPNVYSVEIVEHRECKGREAAVQAAREMLATHAHLFDTTTEIHARLCPEIEWSSP